MRVGAAGALLFLGAVAGVYIQGPGVRAFFAVSGLKPGGGALRAPIAVAPPAAPAEDATSKKGIVALGRLQPVGSVVEVAGPSAASAPRVLDLLVEEGDVVEFDAPIVVLDTYPQALASRDAARRAVDVSEAALAASKRDVSVGQREAAASIEAARAVAKKAQLDLDRTKGLVAGDAVPRAELEAAQAAAEQANAELRRAEALSGRHGSADIRLAEQNVEAAKAELARAEAELRNTTVHAPSTGTVLSINVRPGERASSGTLLTLGDLSRMEAELEVYQEAVPKLSVGRPVRLESPVLQAPLNGTIRRIGLEVGRQSLTSDDPAANTDARVVKAWVVIDESSRPQAARFVGLEVVAHIEVEDP
ncbi:MAG: efflux RND transporter periplasmic adaptor subunit [Deltaproteobacteria bacterium]|nr:efflux RND transporter periplasmic adaptor subunit [Deltaproteobacteria bacterium]